jgi:hypothetical protein
MGLMRVTAWCAGVGWLALAGCGHDAPQYPKEGDCVNCSSPAGSGGAGVGTGGSTGGSLEGGTVDATDAAPREAGTVTVTFSVGQTNDTTFATVSPYDRPVRVSARNTGGTVVDTGDTGMPMSGTLSGVATGPNWFGVEDPSGPTRILPTLQPFDVDPITPAVPLVAITASQLTPLVVDRDQPWAPIPGHATLIVLFTRAGKLLPGITLDGNLPAGSSVVYEQAGAYVTPMADPTIKTDDEGTAIVRDIGSVAAYPMTTQTKFGYHIGTASLSFQAALAADFVTWMTVVVP